MPGIFRDGWASQPVAPAAVPPGRGRHHASFLHLLADPHGLETRSQTWGVLSEGTPGPEQRSEEEQGGCMARMRCWCTVPASCGLKAGAELRFWFLHVPYLIAAGTLLSALVQPWQKVGCQFSREQGCAELRCQNSTAMPLCASEIRYKRGLLSHSFTGLLFSGSSCCLGEDPVQMEITI